MALLVVPMLVAAASVEAVGHRFRQADVDLGTLGIEVGRLDLMVDQIAMLLDRPALMQHAEKPPESAKAALLRLRGTASRFNALLPASCHRADIPDILCKPAVLTVHGNSSRAVMIAAEKLFSRIFPVRQMVCRGHESQCQLE